MPEHEKINYVELPAADLTLAKQFFSAVFGWEFVDYGEDYTAFHQSGVAGGFYKAELSSLTSNGSALVVLYSTELEQAEIKVKEAGGKIIRPIISFPGGRRFQFTDLNGNEFGVWSDK